MPDLEHPPKLPRLDSLPAVVEPKIRDIPEFEGTELEIEEVEVERLDDDLSEELRNRALEFALGQDEVRRLLDGREHVVLGVSRLDGKRTRQLFVNVVVFSYDDAATHEIRLAVEGDSIEFRDVATSDFQPGPSDDELQRAIELARSDDRVGSQIEEGFFAEALLVSAVEPGDEHFGRRRFSVVFGDPAERLPRVNAVVDLLEGALVSVHVVEGGSR